MDEATALLTDRYELTMLDAALRDGSAERLCVFETFARDLPQARRYGVVAGLGRLVEAISRFRFGGDELGYLDDTHVVSAATLRWLAGYEFTGELYAYREGELYFPGSPVLTVVAPFAHAVVLETLVLSVLNHDSAVASAAARMALASRGRPLLEFGSRRTHEQAAVAAARATIIGGFAATSNLEAGRRFDVTTAGTSAHAFTLVHDDEADAFTSQLAATGGHTTLLVDTFDIAEGINRAVEAVKQQPEPHLDAIRLDSGDPAVEVPRARAILDAAGLETTRIVVSGDLDEFSIERLADAEVDAFGVGTSVVTGSGAPTAGFVYKLVARTDGTKWQDVAKEGGEKATLGGRKQAYRALTDGTARAEVLQRWGAAPVSGARALQVEVLVDGELRHAPGLDAVRHHCRAALDELDDEGRLLQPGAPAIPTDTSMLEERP